MKSHSHIFVELTKHFSLSASLVWFFVRHGYIYFFRQSSSTDKLFKRPYLRGIIGCELFKGAARGKKVNDCCDNWCTFGLNTAKLQFYIN